VSDAVCRRCHRPLRSALTVRAGVGARCALHDAAEAAAGPSTPAVAVTPLAAAIGVATAAGLPRGTLSAQQLVADADPLEVVTCLGFAFSAALKAMLGKEGRAALLAELGLDAAQGTP
jgi:hypothetical protein